MKSQLFLDNLEEGAWGKEAPPPVPSLAASRLARLTSGLDVEVVSDLLKVKTFLM